MYTYNDLLADLNRIQRMGARIGHIGLASLSFADAKLAILTDCRLGAAVSGRMIPYAHIGSTEGAQIIVQGAIHAREHITAKLIVEQIYYILQCGGETLKKGGMYFIPMTNPNGVTLAQFGLESVYGCARRNFLLRVNGEAGCDFSLWKANLNAVDLNVNFPAEWGTGICNVRCPSPTNYIGASPASEPETRALMAFTQKIRPAATLSYHAKGQEIYWDFGQRGAERERDCKIACKLSALTGCTLINGKNGSAGGYKDWCIQELKIPAFTLEIVSSDAEFPIDYSYLSEEVERNKDVPLALLEMVK